MKVNGKKGRWLLGAVLILTVPALAAPRLGIIAPGEYQAYQINNHTPESFKSADQYWDSLQQVDLEIGGAIKFRDLPKLGMRHPYTGYIKLGDPPRDFGVIVDVYGEEKRLYIDTDADGSMAGEPMALLLNEWLGFQQYWLICPEPLELKVKYRSYEGQFFPIQIMVHGFLNQPGPLAKEKPFLKVQVRTWFLSKPREDGFEKLSAVVDRNNNGRYNDPQDQFFIDYNDNGYFEAREDIVRGKGIKLKSGKRRLRIDWDVYPTKLIVEGERL